MGHGLVAFDWKGESYNIDHDLAIQLDTIVYNIKKDWDFVIMVSGNRMVRVGKSVLAQKVCAYIAWGLAKTKLNPTAFNEKHIFFESNGMIDFAREAPKHSVVCYDEGREGLAAIKAMSGAQQDLIDFFTECGQLNHVFVIVAPDYFDLKEDIAVGRSEILLNVYRQSLATEVDMYKDGKPRQVFKYRRGYFTFFNRKRKAVLYDVFRTTRRKSYSSIRANFTGTFNNDYMVDEATYKKMKSEALMRFNKKEDETDGKSTKMKPDIFIGMYEYLNTDQKKEIARNLGHDPVVFAKYISGVAGMAKKKLKTMRSVAALKKELIDLKNKGVDSFKMPEKGMKEKPREKESGVN